MSLGTFGVSTVIVYTVSVHMMIVSSIKALKLACTETLKGISQKSVTLNTYLIFSRTLRCYLKMIPQFAAAGVKESQV